MKRTYFRLNIFILILVITAFSVRFSFKLARVLVWRRQIWTSTVTTARVLVQMQTSIINSASSAIRVELMLKSDETVKKNACFWWHVIICVGILCILNAKLVITLSSFSTLFSKTPFMRGTERIAFDNNKRNASLLERYDLPPIVFDSLGLEVSC